MNNDKLHVLVVDDDQRILKMLKLRLKIEGYDVSTAQDGEEALRLVEVKTPDILLLDMAMPVLDGMSVLKQLRLSSSLPVIALSANREYGEKSLKLGADVFISKPFDPDNLMEKIKSVLERTPALPAQS